MCGQVVTVASLALCLSELGVSPTASVSRSARAV